MCLVDTIVVESTDALKMGSPDAYDAAVGARFGRVEVVSHGGLRRWMCHNLRKRQAATPPSFDQAGI
jgi:hypothetical protein